MSGGRPKKPIELIVKQGKWHITKAEIEKRRAEEISFPDDTISPPPYLTKKQCEEFWKIADQLIALKVMKNLDVDSLAAYIQERDDWIAAVKQLRKKEVRADVELFEKASRNVERCRRQMRASATDLGLTITSRGRMVLPEQDKKPPENKFAQFQAVGDQ